MFYMFCYSTYAWLPFQMQRVIVWSLALFLCIPSSAVAQKTPDNTRLQRDAEVLRNLLNEFFKTSNPNARHYVVSTQTSDVKYFPGFGLLIEAPVFRSLWHGKNLKHVYIYNYNYNYNGMATQAFGREDEDEEDDHDDEEDDDQDHHTPAPPKSMANDTIIQVMKSFVASYGSLMNFLQPNEKIFFYYDKATAPKPTEPKGKPVEERIALEWNQADTRLTGPEMAAKTRVSVMPVEQLKKPEFDVMGKIFYNTFSSSSDSRFVANSSSIVFFDGLKHAGESTYEVFKGLGVLYHFSVTHSRPLYGSRGLSPAFSGTTVLTDKNTVIVSGQAADKEKEKDKEEKVKNKHKNKNTDEKDDYSDEEEHSWHPLEVDKKPTADAQKKAEAEYGTFLTSVKEYLIEYGRTLRSLEPAERIVIDISLNRIYVSSLPGKIELSVSKSVLDEYDKQTISLADAVSRISVREYPQTSPGQRTSSTTRYIHIDR